MGCLEMPWDAKSFASKHNHKLKGAAASKAASQASAMVRAGVPEGEAIATANKTGNRMQSHSPRNAGEQAERRRGHGLTYREVAKEQGTSASTAHRRVKKQDMMRQGFVRGGSARD